MRNVCLVALAVMLPASVFAQTAPASQASTTSQATSQPAPAPKASTGSQSKGYVAVHVGGQTVSSSLRDVFTFSQYDETATVTNDEDYGGSFLFNVEGAVRMGAHLGFGVALSRAAGDINANVTASIPNPQVFDQPRTASFEPGSMRHSETAVHFFAAYFIPAGDKFDLRIFAGPSIIGVSHDLVSAITFQETAPFTSVALTGATIDERTKTVGAFHVGVGGNYRLTDKFGVDGFLRFARRTVDLPGVSSGTTELKVGGAQLGIGVTYGF
jgi:hypothetical protein